MPKQALDQNAVCARADHEGAVEPAMYSREVSMCAGAQVSPVRRPGQRHHQCVFGEPMPPGEDHALFWYGVLDRESR